MQDIISCLPECGREDPVSGGGEGEEDGGGPPFPFAPRQCSSGCQGPCLNYLLSFLYAT
jgi:hypothetical protein